MGHLVKHIRDKPKGAFTVNTTQNPKEHCNQIKKDVKVFEHPSMWNTDIFYHVVVEIEK